MTTTRLFGVGNAADAGSLGAAGPAGTTLAVGGAPGAAALSGDWERKPREQAATTDAPKMPSTTRPIFMRRFLERPASEGNGSLRIPMPAGEPVTGSFHLIAGRRQSGTPSLLLA